MLRIKIYFSFIFYIVKEDYQGLLKTFTNI